MSGETPTRLIVLGAGTFAQEVADLISDLSGYVVEGFAVSVPPLEPGRTLLGMPVHWVDDLWMFAHSHLAIAAMASTKRQSFIERVAEFGFHFATIVHPTARVSRTATVGEGSIVSAGAIISAHSVIGRHVILNRGVLIGHDVSIGDYSTVGPGANLAGGVSVGARATIGMSAIVLEKRRIGERTLVGAGALVNRDVPPRTVVIGSPAQIVEQDFAGY